jgi:hypothetical protein
MKRRALMVVALMAACAHAPPAPLPLDEGATKTKVPLPPPGMKACIVAFVINAGGTSVLPPMLVSGTGDPDLDEKCRSVPRAAKLPFAAAYTPIQLKEVLWVSPAGAVHARAATGAGGLSREEIQGTVQLVLPAIKRCYEIGLDQDDSLAGKVLVSWVIDGAGEVAAVGEVASALADNGNVASCVAAIVKQLRFPLPAGGGPVFVTYPFVFTSTER